MFALGAAMRDGEQGHPCCGYIFVKLSHTIVDIAPYLGSVNMEQVIVYKATWPIKDWIKKWLDRDVSLTELLSAAEYHWYFC